jgi:hypothetical protein
VEPTIQGAAETPYPVGSWRSRTSSCSRFYGWPRSSSSSSRGSRSCSRDGIRAVFDFVLGMFRWTNRVGAYAFLLVTDRYPPFRLSP